MEVPEGPKADGPDGMLTNPGKQAIAQLRQTDHQYAGNPVCPDERYHGRNDNQLCALFVERINGGAIQERHVERHGLGQHERNHGKDNSASEVRAALGPQKGQQVADRFAVAPAIDVKRRLLACGCAEAW
ncbi:hypothetical protein NBRC116588_28320 [Pyruvatibacter sp. HU-CL02332]